jgi:imidazoleglycerol-phosphate dehydratase
MTALVRKTKETRVQIAPAPTPQADTQLRYFDHLLLAFLAHGQFALSIEARGDLRHHVIEDVALTLGRWFRERPAASVARFGECTVAMDDALVQAVIDFGGRAYFAGRLPNALYTHFLRSLSEAAGMTLHVRRLRGSDRHHVHEAAFKAVGRALRQALAPGAGLSTKGAIEWERQT